MQQCVHFKFRMWTCAIVSVFFVVALILFHSKISFEDNQENIFTSRIRYLIYKEVVHFKLHAQRTIGITPRFDFLIHDKR